MGAKMLNPNKKIVLGITGELLSGKSSAAEFYIKEFAADYFKFAALLVNALNILGLPLTRLNQQDMAAMLKEQFGGEVLVNALAKKAARSDKQFLLFEGLRKPDEVAAILKEIPDFKLIYIEAKLETRFERQQNRQEKAGENSKTFEEFIESHKHSADASIPLLLQSADYVIHNDGSVDEFQKQLRSIVKKEST
jgi:dephospho-CoA kinase